MARSRDLQMYCKCAYCEIYFPVGPPNGKGRARWFCTPSHRVMFNKHGGREKRKVMGECLICGKLVNRTNQVYCSAACRQRAYRNRKEAN